MIIFWNMDSSILLDFQPYHDDTETPIRTTVLEMITKHHFEKPAPYPTVMVVHTPPVTVLVSRVKFVRILGFTFKCTNVCK